MTDETHERPTTASIDRRVERLELSQAATERKVDELTAKLGYMEEFLKLKFSVLEAGQSTQTTRFEAFTSKIDAMIHETVRQAGDLEASAVGRGVSRRLVELERVTESHQTALDQVSGAVVFFRGLAALGAALGGVATAIELLHIAH